MILLYGGPLTVKTTPMISSVCQIRTLARQKLACVSEVTAWQQSNYGSTWRRDITSTCDLSLSLFSGVPLVAMSTMRRQSVRSLAVLQATWSRMLTDCTSELIPLRQVEPRRPQGLLQWVGGRSDASITRRWSYQKSARATCPKKRNRLSWIRWETGQQPVVCLAAAFYYSVPLICHFCFLTVNYQISIFV